MNFTYIFWSMNNTIIESGFGRVSTLASNDSTISEEVPIEYENKVAIHDATKLL